MKQTRKISYLSAEQNKECGPNSQHRIGHIRKTRLSFFVFQLFHIFHALSLHFFYILLEINCVLCRHYCVNLQYLCINNFIKICTIGLWSLELFWRVVLEILEKCSFECISVWDWGHKRSRRMCGRSRICQKWREKVQKRPKKWLCDFPDAQAPPWKNRQSRSFGGWA